MKFYYTLRAVFNKNTTKDGFSWEDYIEFNFLAHCTEIVSLDCMLNEDLVLVDINDPKTYDYLFIDGSFSTYMYSDLEFVMQNVDAKPPYNVMACVVEPTADCAKHVLKNFEFVGYDLMDKSYDMSALTNCGGTPEVFLPSEQNQFGLIADFEKAYDIKKRLFKNNPNEYHANCNVIALWRHKKLGRLSTAITLK